MRIASVEAIPFRLPVRREFRWAGLHARIGSFVLVRILTDDGLAGLGEATPLPDWGGDFGRRGGETQETVVSMVTKILAPVLIGRDPASVELLLADMDRVLWGHNYAKAAIDIALHDLRAKAMGQPLYAVLGGAVRPAVPLAHMIGLMSDADALAEGTGAVGDGIGALQVKGGEDPERDIRLLTALRARLGPAVRLRLDANQGYGRPKDAINMVRQLGPGVLDMLEQPVTGLRDMAAVTRAVDLTVIADESCWDARATRWRWSRNRRPTPSRSTWRRRAESPGPARWPRSPRPPGSPATSTGPSSRASAMPRTFISRWRRPRSVLASVIPVSAPAGFQPFQVGGAYYEDDIIREPFKASQAAPAAAGGPRPGRRARRGEAGALPCRLSRPNTATRQRRFAESRRGRRPGRGRRDVPRRGNLRPVRQRALPERALPVLRLPPGNARAVLGPVAHGAGGVGIGPGRAVRVGTRHRDRAHRR